MNFKGLTAVILAGTMAVGLTACGEKEQEVEQVEVPKVEMHVTVENGLDVNIVGLSISSDTRVDDNEQVNNPENTYVTSILDGNELNPGDSVSIDLTVDDPTFHQTTAEDGTVTGIQKFIITVTDINGNVNYYTEQDLNDGAYFTVTKNGLNFESHGMEGKAATDARATSDAAYEAWRTADEALEVAKAAEQELYAATFYVNGGNKLGDDGQPIMKDEDDITEEEQSAYDEVKSQLDAAQQTADDAKKAWDEADKAADTAEKTAADLNGETWEDGTAKADVAEADRLAAIAQAEAEAEAAAAEEEANG